MITQAHRFHGRASLPALYRRGRTVRSPLMNLKFSPRRTSQPYRLSVVVGRKVNKSAVVRNRIRRRIYETIRVQHAPLLGAFDMAIIVYASGVADLPQAALVDQLAELLGKAGISSEYRHAIVNVTGK